VCVYVCVSVFGQDNCNCSALYYSICYNGTVYSQLQSPPRCVVCQGWNAWACEYPYLQTMPIRPIPKGPSNGNSNSNSIGNGNVNVITTGYKLQVTSFCVLCLVSNKRHNVKLVIKFSKIVFFISVLKLKL